MMTNTATTDSVRQHAAAATMAQKVVIVNGSADMLEMLETVLDAGHYDVVFVESSQHAYSQIKRVQPNLVILCVRTDDADGFQVLTMLKLDDDTSQNPGASPTPPKAATTSPRSRTRSRPTRSCFRRPRPRSG